MIHNRPALRLRTLAILAPLALLAPAAAAQSAKAPSAPTTPISPEAKRHFEAGVTLLQDPEGEKVEEAYREFRTAYDLSGSAKILGNMGFCAMRLERDGEAIDAYSRYLRDVPDIDADERAQIVRDLQTLTVGVVRLSIEVNKPGVTLIDERVPVRGARVTNAYGPVDKKIEIGIRPGHHIITAKLPGHEEAVWELEAYAATRDKYSFTMKEPPKPVAPQGEGGSRTNAGPFIVMGVGAALLVGGAITGVIALGKTSDIETRCPNDLCARDFDLDDERSSARTFVRITDVLLVTGAAAVIGGGLWLLLTPSHKTESGSAWNAASPLRVRF
jgi:hypothetical protein